MKSLPALLGGLLFVSTITGAFAAAPAATPPPAAPAPNAKPAAQKAPPPAPAPEAAAPEKAALKPDDYFAALASGVNLSDPEKKEITDIYEADGATIQKIGNDATLSPLQKAQQIADLRDVRNSKIEDILHDIDRKKSFHDIEAVYRVDVTVIALDGGLLPPPPPAPAASAPAAAPAPAKGTPAPAQGTPPPAGNAAPPAANAAPAPAK